MSDAPHDPDIAWMRVALDEARAAFEENETPVGAVVVRDGQLVSRAHDGRQAAGDPTAHAEILALSRAGRALGDWRLDGCDLYVTLEPCPMCAGAILLARIRRLIYGAPNHKAGAVQTHCQMLDIKTFNHHVAIRAGVEDQPAADLLQAFFARLRTKL